MKPKRFFIAQYRNERKADAFGQAVEVLIRLEADQAADAKIVVKPINVAKARSGDKLPISDLLLAEVKMNIGEDADIIFIEYSNQLLDIYKAMDDQERLTVRTQQLLHENGVVAFVTPVTDIERQIILSTIPILPADDDFIIACIAEQKGSYVAAAPYRPGEIIEGLSKSLTNGEIKAWSWEGFPALAPILESHFPNPVTMAI